MWAAGKMGPEDRRASREERWWGEGAKKPEQNCHLTKAQQGVWRPQACHPGRSSEPSEKAAKHCPR